MKVLHVINSLALGGAERLLTDLAPALRALGLEVSLFVLDARGDVFSSELRAAGVEVFFAKPGGLSPYSPAAFFALRRHIARARPDIVHAHLAPSQHWSALAVFPSLARIGAFSKAGAPRKSRPMSAPRLVLTEHAVSNRRMDRPLLQPIELALYKRYDRIVCVARESAEALESWLGDLSARVSVINNGIALDRFEKLPRPEGRLLDFSSGRKLLLMVSRFVPAKDQETALRALALLPGDYAMAFVGDGPTRERSQAITAELGLGDRVLFAGAMSDARPAFAAADIYVQSSHSEGLSIAALEAMASGLPVVASEVGGLASLVHGVGLGFPARDFAACASALRSIGSDPELAARLVVAGRLRAAENSIAVRAAEYAALYAEFEVNR